MEGAKQSTTAHRRGPNIRRLLSEDAACSSGDSAIGPSSSSRLASLMAFSRLVSHQEWLRGKLGSVNQPSNTGDEVFIIEQDFIIELYIVDPNPELCSSYGCSALEIFLMFDVCASSNSFFVFSVLEDEMSPPITS
ncbi:C-Maf-inducing protein [Striga asiatica]|uniref:C-Maf-inducing protein n=1 Tax=Striga asiatica TaxID=4170 RepID=A0A5A7RDI5_STRAF|nr:C-Maf-inducing protein [Striga asiatica]